MRASDDEFANLLSTATLEIKSGVKRLNFCEDERQRQEQHKRVLEWLSKPDHISRHEDVLAKQLKGTGKWLLESPEYADWFNTPGATILCTGAAGTGNSILFAATIEHPQKTFGGDPKVGICCFYFTYRDHWEQGHEEQDHEVIFRSILPQLLETQETLPEAVVDLYTRHQKNQTRESLFELEEAFNSVVAGLSRTLIVLDGLDEYPASDWVSLKRFLSKLTSSQQTAPINLIVSSRPISEITAHIPNAIEKHIQAHGEDLASYIKV